MSRRLSSTPSEAELEILQVLWQDGPATVRHVHNALKDRRGTRYSTTLKTMQLMTDKGLLVRDDSVRPQEYSPANPQEHTQLQLVDELIQRGFGGSGVNLVLRAVSGRRVSPEDLDQIRKLIHNAKGVRK